jgi:putative Holliday junction resolvase
LTAAGNSAETKYLAIDYGLKRIGIAVSDPSKIISFPREYIFNDSKTFDNIINIIKNDNIIKIVLGLPSEKSGFADDVKSFSGKLSEKISANNLNAEIVLYDERFTSKIAEYNMRESVTKKKNRKVKGTIDSLAAQVLLQNFLDREHNLT